MSPVTHSTRNEITADSNMSHTIKVSFQGNSRVVQLAEPATVDNLQVTVASNFELQASSIGTDKLRFTYHDSEGDDITIAMDSELALALRLCKGVLDIQASLADGQQQTQTQQHRSHDVGELFDTAAAELRTSRGVPSMTADKLRRTLALLQLDPRGLVAQGLVPRRMLTHKAAGTAMHDDSDANMDHGHDKHGEQQDVAVATVVGGDPIHSAFVSRGVALEPHETGPLLAALGVGPRRLVGVGLVDRRVFRAYMSRSLCLARGEARESTDIPDIYKVAAGALRASHGVASMTAVDLKRTMALLELPSRRLVHQGLAPRHLLKGESTSARGEAGGDQNTGADVEGAVDDKAMVEEEGDGDKGSVHIHAVLVSRGITSVSASEVRPLLRALGIRPQRLVRLGLVERGEVRLESNGARGGSGGRRGGCGRGRGRDGNMGMGRGHRPACPGHHMRRCNGSRGRETVVGQA